MLVRCDADTLVGDPDDHALRLRPDVDRYGRARRRIFRGVLEDLAAGFLDQSGIDMEQRQIVGKGDFDAQMKQVLANIEKALKSVDASFTNVVQFTTYLVHSQDIANFRRVREELFPSIFPAHRYPPNTLLVVDRLVQEDFLIEIETTAAL